MARFNWKKTLVIVLDVVVGVYIVLAFAAFHTPDRKDIRCEKVSIDIADETTYGFLTASDVKQRLVEARLYPYNKPMDEINVRAIEEKLKSSAFVRTAECYKTNDGQIRITLTQRLPILRIKAGGDDYYIDDNDKIMRPSGHYTSDLIIATGAISQWYARNYISHLAQAIMSDDFWRNQIEQINVLPDHGIELVPRVGNHIVYIGQLPESKYIARRRQLVTDYVTHKLDRLMKFYKYGLSVAGWNKYSYINLEFDNQIICKKRSHLPAAVTEAPAVVPDPVKSRAATEASLAEQSKPDAGLTE